MGLPERAPVWLEIAWSVIPLIIALSGTSPNLEQDPSASVSLAPNSADRGSTVTVAITGTLTNFVPGATMANFGPGISVEGGAAGEFSAITVTGATATHGSVVVATNGVLTYTAPSDLSGSVSISYTVADAQGLEEGLGLSGRCDECRVVSALDVPVL